MSPMSYGSTYHPLLAKQINQTPVLPLVLRPFQGPTLLMDITGITAVYIYYPLPPKFPPAHPPFQLAPAHHATKTDLGKYPKASMLPSLTSKHGPHLIHHLMEHLALPPPRNVFFTRSQYMVLAPLLPTVYQSPSFPNI